MLHDGVSGTNIKKYRGPRNAVKANHSNNGGVDFNNHRWFRYGGMLLLHAEALIQNGNTAQGWRLSMITFVIEQVWVQQQNQTHCRH